MVIVIFSLLVARSAISPTSAGLLLSVLLALLALYALALALYEALLAVDAGVALGVST
jgi:hypothetical protein